VGECKSNHTWSTQESYKAIDIIKSRPNERDIEPFRTRINSSTALATTVMRGADLKKTHE